MALDERQWEFSSFQFRTDGRHLHPGCARLLPIPDWPTPQHLRLAGNQAGAPGAQWEMKDLQTAGASEHNMSCEKKASDAARKYLLSPRPCLSRFASVCEDAAIRERARRLLVEEAHAHASARAKWQQAEAALQSRQAASSSSSTRPRRAARVLLATSAGQFAIFSNFFKSLLNPISLNSLLFKDVKTVTPINLILPDFFFAAFKASNPEFICTVI